MNTDQKNPTKQAVAVRDFGLASAFAAAGIPLLRLESSGSSIHFIFEGYRDKLDALESGYWNGTLSLPVRDVIVHHKLLKDRIFSFGRNVR